MIKNRIKNTSLKLLTPEEFIKLYKTDRRRIVRSSIVPPKLGEPGFGKIIIELADNVQNKRTLKQTIDN